MTAAPRVLSGRYRVDEVIGRGGMATVYRGFDQTLGRVVAIKVLGDDLATDNAFRTRFRLEAQAASRMAHPTIVRVFDAGEDAELGPDGVMHPVPYIVMELVEGKLLKDVISAGPVPVDDAVRYTDGILEALEYSHRAGVVHRDIKPGNVMVTPAGQVKVMDFGIARAVSDSSSTVAETTAILGTAAYFSPEQAKGEPVDARTDLYSTGVVLYELLTGRQPFRGESPVAVAYQHVSEPPVPPSEVNEALPLALDTVALRALAKDPYQRYQDAAGFREDLDATVDGKEPSKRAVGALTSELYGPDPRHAAETARSLRQLSTDTTMPRTQSGPPVAWIWAGIGLLVVLVIAVLFWALTIRPATPISPNVRIVPDVVEMSYDRASVKLGEADLVSFRLDEASADVAPGNVVRTEPGAGESVAPGQRIRVFVSTGEQTAVMPAIVGLSQADAQAALEAVGLRLGVVTQRSVPEGAAGVVLSADQSEGADVPVGTNVNLTVATGKVVLNDVTGYLLTAAKSELEDAGLTVVETADAGCPAAPGDPLVESQSLPPGEVAIHSEITLTYCTG